MINLGAAIPALEPHAISVSLPTWRDNVGYEEGDRRVVDAMISGYPRFFIHPTIQKLQSVCESKFAIGNERCMLFPTARNARECRNFFQRHAPDVSVRLTHFDLCEGFDKQNGSASLSVCLELHIVLFPKESFPTAKAFWQHTGLGVSSRRAERCLMLLKAQKVQPPSPTIAQHPRNRHYSTGAKSQFNSASHATNQKNELGNEELTYLEERYGRNLPVAASLEAKQALRRRIAGVLVADSPSRTPQEFMEVGQSTREASVTEDHVFLYPTGMTAIWEAHKLALATLPAAKSICFGFPYTDTLKILQKWGPGCHFFGHGLDSDADALEDLLKTGEKILALFCEFPSNPLLRSPPLQRLRSLADQYDFLIVVDETIGNFANVEVLPYADIVVSSLSKVFSGEVNVMGGSLVINPDAPFGAKLLVSQQARYEDTYFASDAIFMERNSRDFRRRVQINNDRTEAICEFLRSSACAGVVKDIFYPKWQTRDKYDVCRRKDIPGVDNNFGGLFSVTFHKPEAAHAFFDNLACAKGPSLGTNFTLACPYTILAHYLELDWAAGYGVEDSLVRVSVGLEDESELLNMFEVAINAAQAAMA